MARYYRVKNSEKFSDVCTQDVTEEERMDDGRCYRCKGNEWLVLPEWSELVQEGGKQYCVCLNCLATTHL